MKPLAIDLFCGLFQAKFFGRGNAFVQQFVTSGTENPEHVTLRISDASPCPISPEVRLVRYFHNPTFAARFTGVRNVLVAPPKAIEDRVCAITRLALLLVKRAAFLILPASPETAKLSRSPSRTYIRAIALIGIRWRDGKVRAASLAVTPRFCRSFVFFTPDSPSPLSAVIAAPFFVWSYRRERFATQTAV